MTGPTRRRFLAATGAAAASALAGCGLTVGDDSRVELEGDSPAETATTQFRGGLRRRGVFPDATVPESVQLGWALPEVNTGDHTAAKASPVALPGGDVVIPGDSGALWRVGPDGTVRWRTTVTSASRGMHGTPAVANGAVYIGAYDGVLYAFDVESGEQYWETSLGDAIGSSPAYHDGTVYIAVEYFTPSGSMFGVDAVTGEVTFEDPRPTNHPHSTCAIDRDAGRLVVGSNDGNLYAWSYPDLEYQWTFETGAEIKGPIATADGSAFFGSWDHNVYRVALADGTEEWRFETGSLVMTGPSVPAGADRVYVGSHDTNLYALAGDTGERVWSYPTGSRLVGCPTVTSDHVLVGSHDGHCYAVTRDDGVEQWRFQAEGDVSSTPLVLDGAVYVADRATSAYLDARESTAATATDGAEADARTDGAETGDPTGGAGTDADADAVTSEVPESGALFKLVADG